jgi:hypothetical protein
MIVPWEKEGSKYKVSFTKLSNANDSYWSIYLDDEFIFKATLDQIWGERLDTQLAETTATPAYGHEVIRKIRSDGIKNVYRLLTGDMMLERKPHEKVVEDFVPPSNNRLENVG